MTRRFAAPGWRVRLLLATVVPVLLVGGGLVAIELVLLATDAFPEPRNFDVVRLDGSEFLVPSAAPPRPSTVFRHERIPVVAPAGVRRVVCLGGSTTFGHPFLPPAPFANWLEIRLQHLLPEQQFEVWNLGANAWNAAAVADLVAELGDLRPDLYVVYSGHNEFLDENLPSLTPSFAKWCERWRIGRWMASCRRSGDVVPTYDFESRHDVAVHGACFLTADQLDQGHLQYRHALRRIITLAREQSAQVLFCHPVSDLRDTPVEYSFFRKSTGEETRQGFFQSLEKVQGWRRQFAADPGRGPNPPAIDGDDWRDQLEQLRQWDDSVALIDYEAAWYALARGEQDEAKRFFRRARDRDGHPIRATQRIQEVLAQVASEEGCVLADPRSLFDQAAPEGVPGQNGLFVDYCHPDLGGHELIAEAVIRALAQAKLFAETADWKFAQEPSTDRYRELLNLSQRDQAESFAQRGIGVILQSYLDPQRVQDARRLLELAIQTDADCALAYAGLGFLDVVAGTQDSALRQFERAFALNPEVLRPFAAALRDHEAIRQMFAAVSLSFDEQSLRPISKAP